MNKKKIYTLGVVIGVILILVLMFVVSDKALDPESDDVIKLYSYLGDTNIYHCGGLYYNNTEVVKDSISENNLLCRAYYNMSLDHKPLSINVNGENTHGTKTCKLGEGITLAASDEDNSLCSYVSFSKNELNTTYKSVFGEDIKEYDMFFIDSDKACFLEGDTYYCGKSETYNYLLVPDATIYRVIDKVSRKLNGDIIINDYFLKVSDGKCYGTSDGDKELEDCTKALDGDKSKIDAEFLRKYGEAYKHTFKASSDNDSPYWLKSEID